MERSLQIMQPLKRLPWLLVQPKMTLFPSCKFYSWTCFWEKNYHQTRGREGREEGIMWKVKQDSERCGKTTDQPSVSPYSFSFSPAGEAFFPPASWLPPPPGAADTCGNSPPPLPQTCWGRRRPQSARRKWSRGASMDCSSWLAAKWRKANFNWISKRRMGTNWYSCAIHRTHSPFRQPALFFLKIRVCWDILTECS